MTVLGERACRRSADALGGTVGGEKLGVLRFGRLERAKEAIVLGAGNLRRVERVVRMIGPLELAAERLHSRGKLGGGADGHRAAASWDRTVIATPTSLSTSAVLERASAPSPQGSSFAANASSSRRRNPTSAARSRSAARPAGSSPRRS